ncbi:MAG: ABC transporter ATP-binding protein [Roseitalea sp.]|jgi:branched-chain amino acid transport system ATP-binding protein|uniref:ABC transporter ATP-binding protein n=1 Tax=Oceaniradius stylonematis TaxID=2184161 RepID=A0A3A8A9H2_9HYPH|nr:ABC transporter ATP-binding protein [Oceaniradius stylonematis]MBO6554299.1 ABC transporter ATP-binding protein [Roseitalea sp.]MBO6953343.1 ABC transporter ATP-binding protein [Rhizobiaceae bacterium]MBO6593690.1 ABC transporter ATP-binding protein [Roseitalea sp.]MBO6601086.1 ABC transporter ATP-binding protein [Roseitalea sp.]MBO6612767.1 ABC transporter ATP-binding protein [Roseitalea sp.]
MLEASHISVNYGPIKAVRDVSIDVGRGDVVALLGPNGAGKSSLLSSLVGLVPKNRGTVVFDNEEVSRASTEDLIRRGMSVTPEGRRIFGDLTVGENLRLGAAIRSDKDGIAEDTEKFLDLFPILRKRFNSAARYLSGGEQQMLAISRSLMSRPKLLMLDEPSLGLAPRIVDQIFEFLVTLRQWGLTLLIVEQNASEVLEIADRAYVLSTGSIVFSGTANELSNSGGVMELYLGLEGH